MSENIIRVVFDDNSSNNNMGGNSSGNSSPLNETINASESILNSFANKINQAVELVKNLQAQNKVNYTNLKQAASQVDSTFDPKSVRDFNKATCSSNSSNFCSAVLSLSRGSICTFMALMIESALS